MASFTFDDYLREMYLTVEDIKEMNPEMQMSLEMQRAGAGTERKKTPLFAKRRPYSNYSHT